MPRLAAVRAARGYVDDPAAGLLHVLHGAPGHVGRSGEVDGERVPPGILPLLVGHVGDRVRDVNPGVVDQHVQAAQVRVRPVDHPSHGPGIGQVGLHDRMPATR
jgi:hypothetical protein